MAPRPVGDHSVDTISAALKGEETKTLIKSNLGSRIYLNTIAIAANDDSKGSLTLAWIVFPHDLLGRKLAKSTSVSREGTQTLGV